MSPGLVFACRGACSRVMGHRLEGRVTGLPGLASPAHSRLAFARGEFSGVGNGACMAENSQRPLLDWSILPGEAGTFYSLTIGVAFSSFAWFVMSTPIFSLMVVAPFPFARTPARVVFLWCGGPGRVQDLITHGVERLYGSLDLPPCTRSWVSLVEFTVDLLVAVDTDEEEVAGFFMAESPVVEVVRDSG